MFLLYWLCCALFGIMATVDADNFLIWYLCCFGCFVLGLIYLINGGFKK